MKVLGQRVSARSETRMVVLVRRSRIHDRFGCAEHKKLVGHVLGASCIVVHLHMAIATVHAVEAGRCFGKVGGRWWHCQCKSSAVLRAVAVQEHCQCKSSGSVESSDSVEVARGSS